ncbi:epidermal growth factor receptor substrate 15-like 1 [Silurus meridionalis]|uniref:epidermal growth factor receptor substrate 15-like 1 n=1 Tax=Silurus meridionalis TaxID=175797 RepID=UPI001EEA05D5|nr:epidermal growth factor receptor substrate 15-like 1 [Silurus meridionalis]
MSKQSFTEDPFNQNQDTPALPPKKTIPPRPKPPSVSQFDTAEINRSDMQPFFLFFLQVKALRRTSPDRRIRPNRAIRSSPSVPTPTTRFRVKRGLGIRLVAKIRSLHLLQFGNEAQQMEWAKRESERAERERLKRLRQQEQEDLELAIALSKAEMNST